MTAIIDQKIPDPAKEKLSKYFNILELSTQSITYSSISGHPDIFFFKSKEQLLIAPNLPNPYKTWLKNHNIPFLEGSNPVQIKYPFSACYNAVVCGQTLVHNLKITDMKIMSMVSDLKKLHVNQGYSRCNLIGINEKYCITSDLGIYNTIKSVFHAIYVDPTQILLPGMPYGFFGGCCGIHQNRFFVIGSLNYLKESQKIIDLLKSQEIELIELYPGPLFDGGSILII